MATLDAKNADIRARVIEKATELFWRKGYDGVSVGDLVDTTGLNRYALYQAFGGKRDIFIAILRHYIDESLDAVREILSMPGRSPYLALYECLYAKMLEPDIFPAGCLMCTTAVDVAAGDAEIAVIMTEGSVTMSRTFAEAFARAQETGHAPRSRDPEAFGELANALYFSTGVQARMGRSREDIICALRKTLDSLTQ